MKSIDFSEFTKGFSTKAVHAWHKIDTDTGSITPPLHLTSTFEVYSDKPEVSSSLNDRNLYMDG